jgi:hypothetical protein
MLINIKWKRKRKTHWGLETCRIASPCSATVLLLPCYQCCYQCYPSGHLTCWGGGMVTVVVAGRGLLAGAWVTWWPNTLKRREKKGRDASRPHSLSMWGGGIRIRKNTPGLETCRVSNPCHHLLPCLVHSRWCWCRSPLFCFSWCYGSNNGSDSVRWGRSFAVVVLTRSISLNYY